MIDPEWMVLEMAKFPAFKIKSEVPKLPAVVIKSLQRDNGAWVAPRFREGGRASSHEPSSSESSHSL